jgi:hypothetical protein
VSRARSTWAAVFSAILSVASWAPLAAESTLVFSDSMVRGSFSLLSKVCMWISSDGFNDVQRMKVLTFIEGADIGRMLISV